MLWERSNSRLFREHVVRDVPDHAGHDQKFTVLGGGDSQGRRRKGFAQTWTGRRLCCAPDAPSPGVSLERAVGNPDIPAFRNNTQSRMGMGKYTVVPLPFLCIISVIEPHGTPPSHPDNNVAILTIINTSNMLLARHKWAAGQSDASFHGLVTSSAYLSWNFRRFALQLWPYKTGPAALTRQEELGRDSRPSPWPLTQ